MKRNDAIEEALRTLEPPLTKVGKNRVIYPKGNMPKSGDINGFRWSKGKFRKSCEDGEAVITAVDPLGHILPQG